MADEDQEPVDAESGNEGSEGGGKASMGPVVALLAVFLLGALLVFGLLSLLGGGSPEEEQEPEQTEGALIDTAQVMPLGDVMANVKGEGGRRYVKVTVDVWVTKGDLSALNKPELQNIMRQAMEQRLASFTMTQLNSQYSASQLRRVFEDEVNKELRRVLGTVGTDKSYVREIVITNKLIQ